MLLTMAHLIFCDVELLLMELFECYRFDTDILDACCVFGIGGSGSQRLPAECKTWVQILSCFTHLILLNGFSIWVVASLCLA